MYSTLRIYSTSDCSGSVEETIRVDQESGAFDCDSTVRYASLDFSFSSSCSSALFSLDIATGRCFVLEGGNNSTYTAFSLKFCL